VSIVTDRLTGADWQNFIAAAADSIDAHVNELSQLDAIAGDGDHGVNVETAMKYARSEVAALADPTSGDVLKVTARAFLDEMGGAAGALFGSFFRAAARSFGDRTSVDVGELADAIEAGSDIVAKRGKARPGDKTMLDALVPATVAIRAAASTGATVTDALDELATAARHGAESTVAMTAALGRARYAEAKSVGAQDPGATTVALLFEAWAATASDRSME